MLIERVLFPGGFKFVHRGERPVPKKLAQTQAQSVSVIEVAQFLLASQSPGGSDTLLSLCS